MTKLDWENITNYIDSVGTTDKVFPFIKAQSSVKVTASGARDNIIYTIGGQSGILLPGQSITVTGSITSMTLRASSGIQAFQVWAIEARTEKEESTSTDVVAQLVQKAHQSDLNIRSYPFTPTALVTFVYDDVQTQDWDIIKPIFDSHNVPASCAVITSKVGTSGYMTLDQLNTLYANGWSLASHTATHQNLANLSATDAETELKTSHDAMKQWGFDSDILVIPYGGINDTLLKTVRKYYQYGVMTVSANKNVPPDISNMSLYRKSNVCNSGSTLDQCKTAVDTAIANNDWLIFEDHSWETGYATQPKRDELAQLIEYIQSKGIPIVNLAEGARRKANIIDVGEKSDSNYIRLAKDGTIFGKGFLFNEVYDSTVTASSPITSYQRGMSYAAYTLTQATAAGLPENKAGILTTYRPTINNLDDMASYQTYTIYMDNTVYRRYWNKYSNVWGSFQKYSFDVGSWTGIVYITSQGFSTCGTTKVTNYVEIEKIYSPGGTQPTLTKNLWAKSELSIDSANPTIIGTAGANNLIAYLDANSFLRIGYSASGNNYNCYVRTSFC